MSNFIRTRFGTIEESLAEKISVTSVCLTGDLSLLLDNLKELSAFMPPNILRSLVRSTLPYGDYTLNDGEIQLHIKLQEAEVVVYKKNEELIIDKDDYYWRGR